MPARKPDQFQIYQNALREWAGNAPVDMLDESDKEKLLDAFLRLFEVLDAAELKHAFADLRMQKNLCELLLPLTAAIRWQLIGLQIQLPPFAAHGLTLAVLRWARVWQNDETPGMSKLMAAIDRDLGYLEKAADWLQSRNISRMRNA